MPLLANDNVTRFTESRLGTVVITGLITALLTFVTMWFSVVERGNQYRQDRQFIMVEIERTQRNIASLQNDSLRHSVALAEMQSELRRMRQELDRLQTPPWWRTPDG